MIDDPRDRTAYRIAITMLGLALIVAIIGVCWVAAEHECLRNIPTEIWFLPLGLGGVLVGILIPFPFYKGKESGAAFRVGVGICVVLVVAFIVAICIGHHHHHGRESLALYAVGVTIGAVLVGLPVPSPAQRDR
jgi:peptidoglycan/LPS O-acetylase OafA/YrhL